jgi:hypothetical protein
MKGGNDQAYDPLDKFILQSHQPTWGPDKDPEKRHFERG